MKKKKYNLKSIENFYLLLLQAAEEAGGKGGIVHYFKKQAIENPQLFLGLLGKVLSLKISEKHDEAVQITKIEITAPQSANCSSRNSS